LLEMVQNLNTLKTSASGLATDTALAATTKGRFHSNKPWLPGHNHPAGVKCCSTCTTRGRPCAGHDTQFCTHPGGTMEKQGVGAAREAAHAATASHEQKQTNTPAAKVYTQLTGSKGKVYLIEESNLGKMQTISTTTTTPIAFAGLATDALPTASTADEVEWEGWVATVVEEEMTTSIDWNEHSEANDSPSPPHYHVSLRFQCKTSVPRDMSQSHPTLCSPQVSPQAPAPDPLLEPGPAPQALSTA
ncbi:hypothetical protein C0993_001647, partial [Termitomyces sp. T159_Od127]